MDAGTYHALELQIARDPADTRRIMPTVHARFERILDVGCGAGQTLIASALGEHVTAIGVDVDLQALRIGRRLDSRIDFICCKGEVLPVKSDYFDLVISRVAIPYMHTRNALGEMARVLKPGGTIWFTLHPFSQLLAEFAKHFVKLEWKAAMHRVYVIANGLLAHLTGLEFPSPVNGRYESFQTRVRITHELRRLGFENIHIQKNHFFVVTATKVPARPMAARAR
ncbi:MAG TPA: class I SAM-dependent methyltransferase [Usitatibacter sp.]|nr:class I SAM-dependent methyltransferase [Usitatibacter sp.]